MKSVFEKYLSNTPKYANQMQIQVQIFHLVGFQIQIQIQIQIFVYLNTNTNTNTNTYLTPALLPGGHIRFFGFWMAWFWQQTQVCFGISVSNFMRMSFVAVGRSLTIVSYVAFKMAALWFWTMFKCNPPIAHCHPLLWGGGILVDHWSTISSYGLSQG